VDLRSGVATVLATQATHLSHSSRVTSTSTSISVRTSSNSTVRITSREEINISVRATRHPIFLPQQPTRTTKQRQRKEGVVHVSIVGNKATGRIIAQRKQLSSSQLPTQSDRMLCSKEATTVASLMPSMER
jgi:ribosomal protein L31